MTIFSRSVQDGNKILMNFAGVDHPNVLSSAVIDFTTVPEPSTFALAALAAWSWRRRYRRQNRKDELLPKGSFLAIVGATRRLLNFVPDGSALAERINLDLRPSDEAFLASRAFPLF